MHFFLSFLFQLKKTKIETYTIIFIWAKQRNETDTQTKQKNIKQNTCKEKI